MEFLLFFLPVRANLSCLVGHSAFPALRPFPHPHPFYPSVPPCAIPFHGLGTALREKPGAADVFPKKNIAKVRAVE
jgi:hypothetical protein